MRLPARVPRNGNPPRFPRRFAGLGRLVLRVFLFPLSVYALLAALDAFISPSAASGVHIPGRHLSIIIVDNYYPYTFMNEQGQPDGYSVDLARAVTRVMGYGLDIRAAPWGEARRSLMDGDIDFLPMMAYSLERDRTFDFSDAHTIAHDTFFVKKGGLRLATTADLKGRSVAVMKNDAAHDFLLSGGIATPEKLVLVESLPDALRKLSLGEADAALMPKLVGLLHVRELGLANIEVAPAVVHEYNRPFSFAVREGNRELLEHLSEGLAIIKASGEYADIHKKWFVMVDPPELTLRGVLGYLLWGGGALLVMVLGAIGWSLSLQRRVAIRTRALVEEIAERKRVEEALQRSEGKARSVLESISDAFFSMDDNLVVTYFNTAAERLLNRKAEEVLGHYLFDAFPEAAGSVFDLKYHQAVREKTAMSFEVYFDVEPYRNWYDVRVYPQEEGISVYFRVVTEQRQTAQLLEKRLELSSYAMERDTIEVLRKALDLAEELTGSTIAFYHYVDATEQNIILQQWSTKTVREFCKAQAGDSHYGIDRAGVWADCVRERRAVIHNDLASLPYRKGLPEGHALVVRDLVAPILRAGRIVAILGVGNKPRDYTDNDVEMVTFFADHAWDLVEHKRAEEKIRQLNLELEGRIRERTAQLEAANKELEAFSYSVSHDLRAPLRHITGFVNLLTEHQAVALDEKSRHYLMVISASAIQMGRLIDDILSFSRMGRVEMMRSDVDLEELVGEVRAVIQSDLGDREVDWVVGGLPHVRGDRVMLKMVFANLLGNAVKFTREKPRARIEISSQPGEGQEEVIFIRDNGAGFDMQYADKLFKLFQRLHRLDEFEGTGVGLANVRRIVTRHGGRAWAEGREGEGATFYVSLPKQ